MAARPQRRWWRTCRIACRWLRIGALFLLLLLLGALLYLNQVGLPDFMKEPLLARLRDRGVDLQFSRLRWRWNRGIVAENVRFGRARDPLSPALALKQVELRLDYHALARLRFQVAALVLRQGRFTWPIPETNRPPRELSVDNLQTELRLLPGDRWELDHCRAQFAGAQLALAGVITNASALRDWKIFHPKTRPPAAASARRARRLADWLDELRFAPQTALTLDVRGNALRPRSFVVELHVDTPQADTPWGTVRDGAGSLRVFPVAGGDAPPRVGADRPVGATGTWADRQVGATTTRADFQLQAGSVETRWAALTNLALTLNLTATNWSAGVARADLDLTAAQVRTKWGEATDAHLSGNWVHALTNTAPFSGRAGLRLATAQTRWGGARDVRLTGAFSRSARPAAGDASWAWWTNLAPFALNWTCRLADLRSPRLAAGGFFCAGDWRAPGLRLTRLAAQLYGGGLSASAAVNVASRKLEFSGASDFDVKKISDLLTERSREWLAQYSWKTPPQLRAEGSLTLPAWTNRHPNWRADVKPTVALRGHFHIVNGAMRGIAVESADSDFSYSNEIWRLSDLVARRPDGRVELALDSNERTRDYHFRVHSTLDPRALEPLLDARQRHGFDLVGWTQPPVVDGEIWGRWYERERIGVKARVAAANFTFRGVPAASFQSEVLYTDKVLTLLGPRIVERGARQLTAAGVRVDFPADKIYLTNGVSTADPGAVARAIGPHIGRDFAPYDFLEPPRVTAHGVIPIRDWRLADLHFDVDGGGFQWWKLRVPQISGRVDWVGERLALSGVRAAFYQGQGSGSAEFRFHPDEGTEFRFDATITNANLHTVMNDLSGRTNRLEGRLNAELHLTRANSRNWRSWQGRGRVSLRDGLIWEIPVFGILSPVLDGIMPGLGNSRASEGSASFTLSNGVVRSDNLEIKASAMRLQYWGTVDLRGEVNAHAQAELLRDTWVVGRFLSLALWPVSKIFEYHITGTLHQPRSEPVFFVPRLVLLPLHPIRTMKELVPLPPGPQSTNGPPAAAPGLLNINPPASGAAN